MSEAPPGYQAALQGLAIAPRPDRRRVRVTGRDPAGMMQGVLTNRVPEPAPPTAGGSARGEGRYAAVLTPKGRMVADVRVIRGPREADGLLLDVPAGALAGLLAHLGRYLPPRFARALDASAALGELTVIGPRAAEWLARNALGLRAEPGDLETLREHGWVWVEAGGDGVLVVRSGEFGAPAFDVLADAPTLDALARLAAGAGAAALSRADLEALRVEAGRPAWGAELDTETLPPEAGIDGRAIDHAKGCYTGQEVIVRIRDRGHVNRHLRGLRLGDVPLPEPGTELWVEGRDRPVGGVTSVAASPRAGMGLALAYVRREVEPPATARLGRADGPAVEVVALGEEWWR